MSDTTWLIPTDEAARLQTLRQYEVLPSLRESLFEELVALTARIFSVPISLLALIDETQVHYVANHGMPGNDVQTREEALCSTAILQDKAIVYQDVTQEREARLTSASVQAAQINQLRFYAAAPLRMPDQHSIGSLCVIDRQSRSFTEAERNILEQLAELVSQALVLRYRCRHLPKNGEVQWQQRCTQIQEEVQGLAALVRYLLNRYGVQIPVSDDVLHQVARRLRDLEDVLVLP